jgi:hypothetical protein
VTTPKSQPEVPRERANAVDRLSFLLWALDAHRAADKTRNALWRRIEHDYVRQIEAARQQVHVLGEDR